MKPPVVRNVEDQIAVEAAKAAGRYVYIGRNSKLGTTRWGNPYRVGRDGDRRSVIERYEKFQRIVLRNGGDAGARLAQDLVGLTGKELFCHCSPLACHGDVLVNLWSELTGVSL